METFNPSQLVSQDLKSGNDSYLFDYGNVKLESEIFKSILVENDKPVFPNTLVFICSCLMGISNLFLNLRTH